MQNEAGKRATYVIMRKSCVVTNAQLQLATCHKTALMCDFCQTVGGKRGTKRNGGKVTNRRDVGEGECGVIACITWVEVRW